MAGASRQVAQIYPDRRRVLRWHDALSRLDRITEESTGASIADWDAQASDWWGTASSAVHCDGGTSDLTRASVADKLQRYLLNPDHPKGGDKARWFEQALGFTRANADALAQQVLFDATQAVFDTEHGPLFTQPIQIHGANGRTIPVPFTWIINNDGVIRLVTAKPVKK